MPPEGLGDMPAGTAVKMIVFSTPELSARPHCAESISMSAVSRGWLAPHNLETQGLVNGKIE